MSLIVEEALEPNTTTFTLSGGAAGAVSKRAASRLWAPFDSALRAPLRANGDVINR
jgi:hypothetical protein